MLRYGIIHFPRYNVSHQKYSSTSPLSGVLGRTHLNVINLTVRESYADILILLSAGLLVEVLQVAVVFIASEDAVQRGAWGLCIVI